MPSLHELQQALARAVAGGDDPAALAAIADDPPGASARLGIYRNHYRISLIEALAATFPVVARLVGDDFFHFAARRFITAQPPAEPCLFAYGAGFADTLAALPEASGLVYLADVARLEWALNDAWFAADAPPVAADGLLGVPADALTRCRFPLHPSCRLLASAYPIDRIWRANRDTNPADATIRLDEGGVWLLIRRLEDDVGWIALDAPGFVFATALNQGCSLAEAATRAAAAGSFDPAGSFATLIEEAVLLAPEPPTGNAGHR